MTAFWSAYLTRPSLHHGTLDPDTQLALLDTFARFSHLSYGIAFFGVDCFRQDLRPVLKVSMISYVVAVRHFSTSFDSGRGSLR